MDGEWYTLFNYTLFPYGNGRLKKHDLRREKYWISMDLIACVVLS